MKYLNKFNEAKTKTSDIFIDLVDRGFIKYSSDNTYLFEISPKECSDTEALEIYYDIFSKLKTYKEIITTSFIVTTRTIKIEFKIKESIELDNFITIVGRSGPLKVKPTSISKSKWINTIHLLHFTTETNIKGYIQWANRITDKKLADNDNRAVAYINRDSFVKIDKENIEKLLDIASEDGFDVPKEILDDMKNNINKYIVTRF